jgi:hypothetical protein
MCSTEDKHPTVDINNYSWKSGTYTAYKYQMTIENWPNVVVPTFPHEGLFKAEKVSLVEWSALATAAEHGSLRYVGWTAGMIVYLSSYFFV